MLRELRALFAKESPQLVARIEAGVREDDSAQIHYAAHRLRGQALQIGALEIADLANRIESSLERDTKAERSLAVSELRSKVHAWL